MTEEEITEWKKDTVRSIALGTKIGFAAGIIILVVGITVQYYKEKK